MPTIRGFDPISINVTSKGTNGCESMSFELLSVKPPTLGPVALMKERIRTERQTDVLIVKIYMKTCFFHAYIQPQWLNHSNQILHINCPGSVVIY